MNARLPDVPDRICGLDGQARFGLYRDVIRDGSLDGLGAEQGRSGLARIRQEKCWHYAGISGPNWVAGLAVIRLGYAGAAFVFLFDREEQRFLVDQATMAPPLVAARIAHKPADGASSVFRLPGFSASILKPPGLGRYQLRVRLTSLPEVFDLAAELHTHPAPTGMTAICPVGGQGSVNLTSKQVGLPARGRILLGERSLPFDAFHFGLLDYSHGFLDRTTAWMWACAGGVDARGHSVGLNLVEGFNDSLENVLWLSDEPIAVGPVHFSRDTSGPLSPWTIRDEHGRVDLTFQPLGVRSQVRDIGPLSSHYHQPVGTFSGTLGDGRSKPIAIQALTGVCEEHYSRW
jgi:hypothetical protein